MPKRVKEDEKVQMIIHGLLKLPENRRCINCNSLGPQYVCTTFWTFVCTNCSGVHREFLHRIKSVSAAKFNAEELNALQAGGNERARQIYFNAWDPQQHSFPDGSNLNRLRDFIKHVYVDRKFSSDKSVDKLAMVKVNAKEDLLERRRSIESYSPGGMKDDRSLRNGIDERSRPRYRQEHGRSGRRHRSRSIHFEIVDDRFRDDDSKSGRRAVSHRFSSAESRGRNRSPDSQRSRGISPPEVQSIRDILGDNVPPLQIVERPPAMDEPDGDGSSPVQCSVDEKVEENQKVNPDSLIDFSTDFEASDTAAVPQNQQMDPSIDGDKLALVPSSTKDKTSDASNVNSLDYLFFELSAPAVEPVSVSESPASGDATSPTAVASSNSVSATSTASTTNVPAVPQTQETVPSIDGDKLALVPSSTKEKASDDSNVSSIDYFLFGLSAPAVEPASVSESPGSAADTATNSVSSTSIASEALYKQPWNLSLAPNSQEPSSAFAEQSSQADSELSQDTTSGFGLQAIQVAEEKSSGRKELPVNLFAASYSSLPAPVPSWQMHPPDEVGLGMHYPLTAMPVPTVPHSAKTRNPFDLDDDTVEVQAPMFPSMASLQGALPMASAPRGLLHTSSLNIHCSQFMQPQSSPFSLPVPPHSPFYEMALSPRAIIGQQLLNTMPPFRPRGFGSFDSGEASFGYLNTIQHPNDRYSAPASPNSFSSRSRNPFD